MAKSDLIIKTSMLEAIVFSIFNDGASIKLHSTKNLNEFVGGLKIPASTVVDWIIVNQSVVDPLEFKIQINKQIGHGEQRVYTNAFIFLYNVKTKNITIGKNTDRW
jgi:hypothetical protein